jgi:hypothetical protein
MEKLFPKFLVCTALCAFSFAAQAASISISGQQGTCPNTTITYTASATNIFGSVAGCWEWLVYENGQWTSYHGSTPCPCPTGASAQSSSSFSVQFATLGLRIIKARFSTSSLGFCDTGDASMYTDVRSYEVPLAADVTGGLSFCNQNQTKTVSIDYSPICGWNNQYDWTVTSGWGVIASGGQTYSSITNGIRTPSPSVQLTSPSSTLAPAFSGNYSVTVASEPNWPYPSQTNRLIWIGSPSGAIENIDNPIPGYFSTSQYYTFVASPSGYFSASSWSVTGGYIVSTGTDWVQVQFTVYNSYATVSATISNDCGSTEGSMSVLVGQAGCPPGDICDNLIYPNPSDESLRVSLGESPSKSAVEMSVFDSNSELVLKEIHKTREFQVPVKHWREGVYYVHLQRDGKSSTKRIIVQHK